MDYINTLDERGFQNYVNYLVENITEPSDEDLKKIACQYGLKEIQQLYAHIMKVHTRITAKLNNMEEMLQYAEDELLEYCED